jgi:hypothetical protein
LIKINVRSCKNYPHKGDKQNDQQNQKKDYNPVGTFQILFDFVHVLNIPDARYSLAKTARQ